MKIIYIILHQHTTTNKVIIIIHEDQNPSPFSRKHTECDSVNFERYHLHKHLLLTYTHTTHTRHFESAALNSSGQAVAPRVLEKLCLNTRQAYSSLRPFCPSEVDEARTAHGRTPHSYAHTHTWTSLQFGRLSLQLDTRFAT